MQGLASTLLSRAKEQGINLSVVQGYRAPGEQQALYTSGAGVTNAPALMSYHNYRLAFDVVPEEYINEKNWNPTGELWEKIGVIGEGLGLTWGGRWRSPDRPHFELNAIPIRELRDYWEKFQKIMPVDIAPAAGGAAMIALIGGVYLLWLRPLLEDRGYL